MVIYQPHGPATTPRPDHDCTPMNSYSMLLIASSQRCVESIDTNPEVTPQKAGWPFYDDCWWGPYRDSDPIEKGGQSRHLAVRPLVRPPDRDQEVGNSAHSAMLGG